jgi:transposase
MHVLSDANGLPLRVGLSAANTHDSLALKPMLSHFHMGHESHAADSKPVRLHADKAYDIPHLRRWLWGKRIGVRIARKGVDSSERLGRRRWVIERTLSAARPGRTHDITAARHDHVVTHLRAAGLGALANLGFRGLDNDIRDPVIVTGFTATRAHKLTTGERVANRVLSTGRVPVEHGFVHLKNWRTLTKLRANPVRATHLVRALLVLTNLEVNR